MQISHILSDLTSLRACPPTAALALVHARTPTSQPPTSQPTSLQPRNPPRLISEHSLAEDPDLQRATDLVELHEGVKMRHVRGLDQGLGEARRSVERVGRGLEGGGGEGVGG